MTSFGKKVAVHFSDLLLLYAAQLGTLYFLINTLQLSVDRKLLYFSLVFTALCYWFMKTKWLKIAFGIMMAAAIAFMLPYRASLFTSMLGVISRIASRFYYVFGDGVEPNGDFKGDSTAFFVVFSVLLGIVLSLLMCGKKRRLIPSVIFTALFFIPCITISAEPDKLTMLVLMSFWSVCLICVGLRKTNKPVGATMTFIMLPLFFLLYSGALYSIHPEGYERSDADNTARDHIIETGNMLLGKLGISDSNSTSTDSPLHNLGGNSNSEMELPFLGNTSVWSDNGFIMDLSALGSVTRTGDTILRVQSPNAGRLYLRGYSLDVYAGNSWLSHDTMTSVVVDYSSINTLTAENIMANAGAEESLMKIEPVAVDSPVMFTPYYYSGSYFQAEEQQRAAFVALGAYREVYTVRYVPYDIEAYSLDAPSDALASYIDSVKDVNLELPNGTASALVDIAAQAGIYPNSEDVVSQVADFIRTSGAYNLSVPTTPEGEDFVLYFLQESHKGYCVHFASAAAAMYRALGIPARFVSGFMLDVPDSKADEWVDVTDYSAHAWVEILDPNMGWIPIEVTGSLRTWPEGATTTPEEQPETEKPEAEQQEAQEEQQETVTKAPITPTLSLIPGLVALLILAGLVILVILRRVVIIFLRRLTFTGRNPNKSAVKIWRYYKRLSAYGVKMPQEISTLADRAYFSRAGISSSERSSAAKLAFKTARSIFTRLDGVEKFAFKYVFCLI